MNTRHRRRDGTVLVLTVFFMVGMIAVLAFAIDLGYINVARTELQRTADAAAIAATWELVDEDLVAGKSDLVQKELDVRARAAEYAALNRVINSDVTLSVEDVTVGYLADPSDPNSQITQDTTNPYNAVQVRVRKTSDSNGEVPLFFAGLLGVDRMDSEATATATLMTDIQGFEVPGTEEGIDILPFALDLNTWDEMMDGEGDDEWRWNEELEKVVPGPDSVREVNLFPQGTGSSGNRGTVDIGGSNNSTYDIIRQILEGVSAEDLTHHGGKIELDEGGELFLNGDTGISAGVKNDLKTIIGEPRIITLFSEVNGEGNNAVYTIVGFAGVRIMTVELEGSLKKKKVMVQPANVVTPGGIPGTGYTISDYIFSPVWLVR